MLGLIGKKVGMTQVFDDNGRLTPVTVIKIEDNVVIANRTEEKNGYSAAVIGTGVKKKSNITKPFAGQFKGANIEPSQTVMEFRDYDNEVSVGDVLGVDLFKDVPFVDVTGTSKGKGFAGSIKRHGQQRGPTTHGSNYHRGPGSLGTMLPKRVLKGKNLPGHMGSETVTVQNLEIIEVNDKEGYILVSGNVPGAKNSMILIKSAVKNNRKKNPKEIISFVSETVVDEVEEVKDATSEEVVEEVAQEETNTTEESK